MGLRNFVTNMIRSRSEMWNSMLDTGKKNIDQSCDYPPNITVDMYRNMFDRNGIAERVVSFMSKDCFAVDPIISETEDAEVETEGEKIWKELEKKHCINSLCQRADILSGIGHYGGILFGLNDMLPLDQPAAGIDEQGDIMGQGASHELIYLSTFDQTQLRISDYERDPQNKRFGQPKYYQLRLFDPRTMTQGLSMPDATDYKVHWSRVLHLCRNRLASNVIGVPEMQSVWNYLLDIRKVLGGSAEMFWKGGFPGLAFEVDPDLAEQMEFDPEKLEELQQQMEDYTNDLKRWIAVQGMKANQLQPNVASPRENLDVLLEAICITKEVPKRRFMGSEQGELAADQDSVSYNKKVNRRSHTYLTPHVYRPLQQRLSAFGVLPVFKDLFIDWPDQNVISDLDKSAALEHRVNALSKYVAGSCNLIVPPLEFLTEEFGYDMETAEQILESALQEVAFSQVISPAVDPETGKPLPPGDQVPKPPRDKTGAKKKPPEAGAKGKKPTRNDDGGANTDTSPFVENADCGTGAGGFKPGNDCAKGGGGGAAKRSNNRMVRSVLEKADKIKFNSSLDLVEGEWNAGNAFAFKTSSGRQFQVWVEPDEMSYDQLESEISEMEDDLEEIKRDIENLEQDNEEGDNDDEIEDLNMQMDDMEDEITELQSELDDLENAPGNHDNGGDVIFKDDKGSVKVTGKGEAFEVFSNVVPAVASYIAKKNPDFLKFTAAEKSRIELYDRIVKSTIAMNPQYEGFKSGLSTFTIRKKKAS